GPAGLSKPLRHSAMVHALRARVRLEYPPISDAEFFRNATNAHVEIALVDVLPESGELWATATFHSSHMRHAAREWSFSRVGDRWLLGRGLIVSRCSCG